MLHLAGEHIRTVDKAAEFDGLARAAKQPGLKKRYTDLANCYRLIAEERERLVIVGAVPMDPRRPRPHGT